MSEGVSPMRSGIDWDDAFANGPYIEGAAEYPDVWARQADAWRATSRGRLDMAYGTGPRHRLDLFLPEGPPHGLIVFVHGGYWLKFDKSVWSHLAAGPVARGWAVALPSYTLAPEATLPQITREIAQAITVAAGEVTGPIHLAGHSAGGHLVTRMVCMDVALPVRARLGHVVSISGLHDLRPLLATNMAADLRLTLADAEAESAALRTPHPGPRVTAWVGGHERPEFLRQAAVLREAWARAGVDARLVVDGTRHHFDVIAGLADGNSALTKALLTD
ncbi:MAG: alpha/beta hydrolase [Rhodobacteraceae bacterium]|nr:alpha/beta hydrolase [Paracoccaceae bacterium]TVR43925.1 MAG: alpha/beta hydrolase [Paracoccaceae bacterium]